jgi:hypothetical protein
MEMTEMTDEQRTMLALTSFKMLANAVCAEDSTLKAVLVVTDGQHVAINPMRVSKEGAFSLLVAACTSLEPPECKTPSAPDGEVVH